MFEDKQGFIDKTGKVVIEPKFDDLGWFSEGLAPAMIANEPTSELDLLYERGKWGFIDITGEY